VPPAAGLESPPQAVSTARSANEADKARMMDLTQERGSSVRKSHSFVWYLPTPGGPSPMFLVFVLLASAARLDGPAIVAGYDKLAPSGPKLRVGPTQKGILSLELPDGNTVMLAMMESPVPRHEAEEAAAFTAAVGFKPAPHRAHVIVTMKPPAGPDH